MRLGWAKQTLAAAPMIAGKKRARKFIIQGFSSGGGSGVPITATNTQLDGDVTPTGYNKYGTHLPDGCLTGLGECIVRQVVNLRRIGNPPVEACIRPSAGGLTTPPQDAVLPHKSPLPNPPPIRLSTLAGPPLRHRPVFRHNTARSTE